MSELLLTNIGMLATPTGSSARSGAEQGQIQILRNAWVLISQGQIAQVGTGTPPSVNGAQVVDAGGKLVTPGLVDAHTHLIFGGWRQNELGMKLHGKSYLDIQNAGGGIQSTTNATRQATEEELTQKAAKALDEMMRFGTTTCEAKSGYPPSAVVKVGDTVVDIQEGKNAGAWSIGILTGSNLLGLTQAEYEAMAPDELEQRKQAAAERYLEAGADLVIDSIRELPDAVAEINRRMAEQEAAC